MGADLQAVKSLMMIAAGAADYLCRQQLDGWQLRRAIKAVFVQPAMPVVIARTAGAQNGQINRTLFFEDLQQALKRAESLGQRLVLLHVNVDKFRSINESFGYHQGDELMRKLAERQIHDRKMTETIFRIIDRTDIDTRLLELELTESAMMHDPDYARRCLQELNGLGVSFALDDFGTGFSSLSNLQHFPISLVKIDKSFVQGLGESVGSEHIIRAIISLAHSLQMRVVAEGVETRAQLEFLRQLKCDHIQGFYFARPMQWAQLLDFLGIQSQSACL